MVGADNLVMSAKDGHVVGAAGQQGRGQRVATLEPGLPRLAVRACEEALTLRV